MVYELEPAEYAVQCTSGCSTYLARSPTGMWHRYVFRRAIMMTQVLLGCSTSLLLSLLHEVHVIQDCPR